MSDEYAPGQKCPDCNGTGTYLYADDAPGECPTCDGTGRVVAADGENDSQDIRPALTADEWEFREIHRPRRLDGPVIRITDENALRIGGPGMPTEIRDVNDLAALIALANAAMNDEDPRKFRRDHVTRLRFVLDTESISLETHDALSDLADAIESFLPPEPK